MGENVIRRQTASEEQAVTYSPEKAGSDSRATARSRLSLHAVTLSCILIGALLVSCLHQGSFSPFITCGQPDLGKSDNPSYGYSYYYNGDLLHKENFYPMELVDGFKVGNPGSPGSKLTFAKRRMYYSFLGALLTLGLDTNAAFKLLNFVLLVTATVLVHRFTIRVFAHRAAGAIAAALFLISSPATVFVGDLSPHLLSLVFYAAWCNYALSYRDGKQSWKQVLGLSAFFGLWSLTYSSAFFGLLGFLFVGLAAKQFLHVGLVAGSVFGAAYIQEKITLSFGVKFRAAKEALLLLDSLRLQFQQLLATPGDYAYELTRSTLDYILADNPVLVLVGVMGLTLYRGQYRWLLLVLTAAPLAATVPFWKTAGARGYIASALLLVLIPAAASFLTHLINRQPTNARDAGRVLGIFLLSITLFSIFNIAWNSIFLAVFSGISVAALLCLVRAKGSNAAIARTLGICALIGTVGTQVWWNYGHYDSRPVAANSFIYGMLRQVGSRLKLRDTRNIPFNFTTEYFSYSDDIEGVPRSLGGTRDWSEFVEGVPAAESRMVLPEQRMSVAAILNDTERLRGTLYQQSLMVLLTLAALYLLLPTGPLRTAAVSGFVLLFVSSTLWGSSRGLRKEAKFALDQLLIVEGGQKLQGEIELSRAFVDRLAAAAARGDISDIDVYIKMSKIKRAEKVDLMFFDREISAEQVRNVNMPLILTLPVEDFLERVRDGKYTIPFSVELLGYGERSYVYVGSWLRNEGLTKRRAVLLNPDGSEAPLEWFPAIEIRGRNTESAYTIIGI
ncbi:MAG: hypothetical protein KDD69_01695 [Bdellovibrionales bacterium]|nr:hypothetical protein [Bdellovibrionales bacterium]